MQRRSLAITLMCSIPLAMMMYGCGSSNKAGTGNLGDVATVGDTVCLQCHSSTQDSITGESIVTQYNRSRHYLQSLGCESCHGGGAQHNGVGPLPYPAPDATRCATCHDGTTARATNATTLQAGLAMAGSKVDPTNPSNHANGGYEGVNSGDPCYRCHTGEGAVLSNVAGFTGNNTSILSNTSYKLIQDRDFTKFKGINCNTCHEHGGGLRAVKTRDANGNVVAWDPNLNRKVDQFDLCTSCHNYLENDGTTLIASGTVASGTRPATNSFYHNTAWYRVIASTHWDNPATGVGLPSTLIEGYVIRTTSANPCFDCHGHEAKTNTRQNATSGPRPATIYTDWARSAHAGGILNKKEAAAKDSNGNWLPTSQALTDTVMAAGVDGTSGPAWEHYNWDSTYTGTSGTTADRGYCQKCHTSTGISNYLSNPSTYNESGSGNSFSHLKNWNKYGGSPQNELLYCWGCHSNAGKGTLRNPGAITLKFDADTAAPRSIALPDALKSNSCLVCHGGRGSATGTPTRSTRFVGHHAPAAGTLYSKYTQTGFEFSGRTYVYTTDHFKHDTIGLESNGSGPCASCHMPSKSHTLAVVTKNTDGVITAINSQAVCNTCHTGAYAMTPAKLEEEAAGYANAGLLLKAYLDNGSTTHNYLNATLGSGDYVITNAVNVPLNAYGAYQNYLYFTDEKGGYAHNRMYFKRLLFDSIDWMQHGSFTGSITIPAEYAEARAWFGANATTGIATRK